VERGEAAAARDEFAAAVRLAPWDGEAQIHLAEMEYRFGRIAGACGALRAASEAPAAYAATARTAVSLLAGLGCDTR